MGGLMGWGSLREDQNKTALEKKKKKKKKKKAVKMSLTSFAPSREAGYLDQGGNECHPDTEKHRERDYIGFN